MKYWFLCRYRGGGKKCGRALLYAKRTLFYKGGRRKKVLIVITDGRSLDSVRSPARYLKRRKVTICSVGIGRRYNVRQLYQMASSRRFVFKSRFRNVGKLVEPIQKAVCKAAGNQWVTSSFDSCNFSYFLNGF